MGLFDSISRMFGFGASEAAQQTESPEQKFAHLKQKYLAALNYADSAGATADALYVEGDKLVARFTSPSDDVSQQITQQFNAIDSSYGDLDLQVNTAQPEQAADQSSAQTYTVQSGDSLWKIAKHFYGDGAQYMQIYYANRDKISDPDRINVGWELVIPNAPQQSS
jgi:nucleoid-associated protein YgaU